METKPLFIHTERVDDIPLLLAQMDRMGIHSLLDNFFPTHGNWQGLSLGTVTQVWLAFILSEGDHRMNQVQPWVETCEDTLEICLGTSIRVLNFSDDRLATVLDYLSDDDRWDEFECGLNGQTIRVYDLQGTQVRVDSTTAKGYVKVTPDGLFQLGHSKDNRPDLPQVKINVSTLDPLGMPLTTTVVSGEKADDPLYVPEIRKVQQSLGQSGVTFIGDCKMAAFETRAIIEDSDDFYLCPLPSVQIPSSELNRILMPVWEGFQPLTPVFRPTDDSTVDPEMLAVGFKYDVDQSTVIDDKTVSWTEHHVVVHSLKLAEVQEKALRERLAKATEAIERLNERGQGKKRFTTETELQQAVEAIIKKFRVKGLLNVSYETHILERNKRRYRDRPERVETTATFTVTVSVNEAVLAEAIRHLAWRVYVTNQADLTLQQAVLAYRGEYLIERGFGRLKGKSLSLTPMYLESDERVKGLIRLLTIGLRVLTLVEFQVRQGLQEEGEKLEGLYPGNPKRATANPTTEMMLKAFRGLTLTFLSDGKTELSHLTPLNIVQKRILSLLDFPSEIYSRLEWHSSEPGFKMSEP